MGEYAESECRSKHYDSINSAHSVSGAKVRHPLRVVESGGGGGATALLSDRFALALLAVNRK
jgi:hypothetical protein